MKKLTLQQKITLSIVAKGNKQCALAGTWYENFYTIAGKPKEMDECLKRLVLRGFATRTTKERFNHSRMKAERYAIYTITSEGQTALQQSGW